MDLGGNGSEAFLANGGVQQGSILQLFLIILYENVPVYVSTLRKSKMIHEKDERKSLKFLRVVLYLRRVLRNSIYIFLNSICSSEYLTNHPNRTAAAPLL